VEGCGGGESLVWWEEIVRYFLPFLASFALVNSVMFLLSRYKADFLGSKPFIYSYERAVFDIAQES
jgi:hypothetical protein